MMHSAQVSKWEMKAAPRLSLRIFVGPLTAKELSSDIRLRKCTDGQKPTFSNPINMILLLKILHGSIQLLPFYLL
jgi:hypothetical protein